MPGIVASTLEWAVAAIPAALPTPAIRVEGISKRYRLGSIGSRTLQEDLQRWWARRRGGEDPVRPVDRMAASPSGYVWALRDVTFDVQRGEVLGVIGGNGAGKSTLLKILSRVTAPTAGEVRLRGRVASLLEVGTGFHPDLTGRENVFLNAAILGMTRRETVARFERIAEFSGVGPYMDTPVKRYSSGMYVRLAFAVAAHLEPEILVVDEVLAVGDAEFQRKCLGRMGEVARGGRTVLFVSHNMAAVKALCSRAVLLREGRVVRDGPPGEVIDAYLEASGSTDPVHSFPPAPGSPCWVTEVRVEDAAGRPAARLRPDRPWQVRIRFEVRETLPHFIVALGMTTQEDFAIGTTWSRPETCAPGSYEAVFREEAVRLAPGRYKLNLGLSSRELAHQYLEGQVGLEFDEIHDKESLVNTRSGLLLNQMNVTVAPA